MSEQEFDILVEFGLSDIAEEKKQALREKIIDVIESRFNRALLSSMSENDKKEFDKILASGQGVEEFVQAKVPNFADLHKNIVDDLKHEMMEMKDKVFQA